MLTKNEKNVLRLLMFSSTDYSINNIAKECSLAPNGALKILRKFEKEGILRSKDIANIKSYKIDFNNEKTSAILELALASEPEGRIKHRLGDLKALKEIAKSCIMFGSYTNLKKEPHDMDVLLVLDKNKFREYKRKISPIKDIVPVKIHDVLQTEEDLKQNLIKKDEVVLDILMKGIILWGQKTIVGVIENACKA